MKNISLIYFFVFSIFSFGQIENAFKKVQEKTNAQGLKTLQERFLNEQKERDTRLFKHFLDNPIKQKKWVENEVTYEIYDVVNGIEQIVQTLNQKSANTSRTNKLYNGGGLGLNVEGQGMKAYVWDNGAVNSFHAEFPDSKTTNKDSNDIMFHATHVTGTIVASGINLEAKGMAFQATADCYDWHNDWVEVVAQILSPESLLVSNHSYARSPNPLPEWFFGAYSYLSSSLDEITNNSPFYLPVIAAGNSRHPGISNPAVINQVALKSGYDLIYGFQTAKNALTVGAVEEVSSYGFPEDVVMSNFSSWGPTDDGRIKPEIVTQGVGVFSTGSDFTNHYASASGTSMASPVIAGTALLLQQHYFNSHNQFMNASTLKGLMLHTTDEAGFYQGPDYEFGWGLVNAERAANLISEQNSQNSIINELNINNGEIKTILVKASGLQPLMASICWNDPASEPNEGLIDPTVLTLVNDLDIRITKNEITYYPWTLDPVNYWNAAVRNSDNFRDNFEKIEIDNPVMDGVYTIQITHKSNLVNNNQSFSLVVSGIKEVLKADIYEINDGFNIFPNPTSDIININYKDNSNYFITILNNLGQEVIKTDQNPEIVNLSSLKSGLYYIVLKNDIETFTKKIIKH